MLQKIIYFLSFLAQIIIQAVKFLWHASLGALQSLWQNEKQLDHTFSAVAWLLIGAFVLRSLPVVGFFAAVIAPVMNMTIAGFGVVASLVYLCAHRVTKPKNLVKSLMMMAACISWLALEIGVIPYTIMSFYGVIGICLHLLVLGFIVWYHAKPETPLEVIRSALKTASNMSFFEGYSKHPRSVEKEVGLEPNQQDEDPTVNPIS